jgi:hypothetical protein
MFSSELQSKTYSKMLTFTFSSESTQRCEEHFKMICARCLVETNSKQSIEWKTERLFWGLIMLLVWEAVAVVYLQNYCLYQQSLLRQLFYWQQHCSKRSSFRWAFLLLVVNYNSASKHTMIQLKKPPEIQMVYRKAMPHLHANSLNMRIPKPSGHIIFRITIFIITIGWWRWPIMSIQYVTSNLAHERVKSDD